MEIARALDTLIDIEEDRLVRTQSVEAVLRIFVDRREGAFRARIALSDGSLRCTATGEGVAPATAVSTAAGKLHRKMHRNR